MKRKKQPTYTPPSMEKADPGALSNPLHVNHSSYPIVGIGASAGGLEAFKQVLSDLPANTGMAFVLVQHLDPKHESMSSEIFSRMTQMRVTEIRNGTQIEPNHVYILPSGFGLGVMHNTLNLLPRTEVRGPQTVIDFFLRSLAEDKKDRAVGVILSGTGSDGTAGLEAIKAEGGITIAQHPNSAKFVDMPKNAIASGYVDLILSTQEIAQELTRISHHRVNLPRSQDLSEVKFENSKTNSLNQIFHLLRNVCHVDFTEYKPNTIQRRLEKRMILKRMENLDDYARLLAKSPDEVKALYADILIHVTGFFRDPLAYKALSKEVFPILTKDRPHGRPIRVWIPGCSTGEEVYSIAISLMEFLGDQISSIPIQIFASDISEPAIQKARIGEYPESISREVSAERLKRFFSKTESGHYKVSKTIRDICLFSRHDITIDPPFAKIDLISCRNLMIYFSAVLQKHVIPIFHYALYPKGFLWLGQSETIGGFSNLFSLVDKTHKIYARKNAPNAMSLQFPSSTYIPGRQEATQKPTGFAKPKPDVHKLVDSALQTEYPGVLINEEMEILQFRGRTAPFLEPASGMASHLLFKMARPEFITELRMSIQAAKKQSIPIRKDGLHFKDGRRTISFNLKVIPIKEVPASREHFFLILFESAVESSLLKKKGLPKGKKSSKSSKSSEAETQSKLVALQGELIESQEYQHSLIEKYEATQEDLSTANEELQSANEELQSSNEELETAKEELQSSNEELSTVNDELQSRSLEQFQLSNDLINLLGSVEIPILMLGNDHRIRRFTPLAGKVLNLIPTDVGRPISDLKLNFTAPGLELDLDQLVTEVLEKMNFQEIEVQDRNERWFRLQVRPYKTIDHRIDGAVLAWVDIHALKESLKEVRAARSEAEKANRAKDLFLATLSHELRTPLTSILSWAQMLRLGKLDEKKTKRGIEIIEESGKNQAQLINDLLDVSRIIAGKLSLDLHEVDPSTIIQAAIESIRPSMEIKSIEIVTSFDPNVGTIMADPYRLQQIFWNLLSNAIKFSAPQSKVTIKLEKTIEQDGAKAQALILVSDTGKGVAPEFLPHIFDRFSQEDSSSIRLHGGLGLGLAIVRNLVELHGGTIRAESLGEKKGTTFSVLLPIKSDRVLKEMPLTPRNDNNVEMPQLNGIRILVVDDEPNSREVFSELLTYYGAEIRAVESAAEALSLIQEFKPHVLMSDIAMPGEDGYSLIKKVRTTLPESTRNTPSIAVTAYASSEDVKRILDAGFQVHLPKPVNSNRLIEVISRLAKLRSVT